MSWKMHSLGSLIYSSAIANAAMPILESYGYTCSFTSDYAITGTLEVATPNGGAYSVGVAGQNYGSYPHYLYVNDETWEFVITITYPSYSTDSTFRYLVCAALLCGTNVDTSEEGMFSLSDGGGDAKMTDISNQWKATIPSGKIGLQKAVFFARASAVPNSFVSRLFWGSSAFTPGIVVTVGADNFLCLANSLYAKL